MQVDLNFYLDLVTSEHSTKPKYMAWLSVLLTPLIDAIKLNEDVKKAFDLNTAIGAQLNIIGKWLEQPRQVDFQPTDGSSSVLNDNYYRTVLKAKVVKNQWTGTISNFYSFWNVLFKGQPLQIYLVDNQDMEPVAIIWSSSVDQMMQDLIANNYIVPKPAGLGLTVRRIDSDTTFGFLGTEFTGFDTGTFWTPDNQ